MKNWRLYTFLSLSLQHNFITNQIVHFVLVLILAMHVASPKINMRHELSLIISRLLIEIENSARSPLRSFLETKCNLEFSPTASPFSVAYIYA